MKSIKIKSFCKVNLTLKVLKKLNNGYHRIESLITFCEIFDLISLSVSKNAHDTIFFSGKFKKGINKKKNTVKKQLDALKKNNILEKIPMKRFGTPEEIANLVYFLSSDHSNYITGQNIHVNGGMLMV